MGPGYYSNGLPLNRRSSNSSSGGTRPTRPLFPFCCLPAWRPPLQAILGAPLGVTRLMDLLGEQEVLRNEALLLLTQLAGGSGDLQKIAVFEGAFERLFGIVRCV